MATRRRSAPKGRGGQSGGANPRNDGRITEEQHDEAMRVLRAEYYQSVRGIVHEAARAIKDGEITNEAELSDWIHQTVDGSYWVIYTHANFQVLLVSDNHDAYFEEFGEAPVTGDSINWAALAFSALQRDVEQQMDAEDVAVKEAEEELEEAPRRGRHPMHEVDEAAQRLPNGQRITWKKIKAKRGEYGGFRGKVDDGSEYHLNQTSGRKFALYYFTPSGRGPSFMGNYPSLAAAKKAIADGV